MGVQDDKSIGCERSGITQEEIHKLFAVGYHVDLHIQTCDEERLFEKNAIKRVVLSKEDAQRL